MEAECLVVDLWGRCQDDDQTGQRHKEEAKDQRLRRLTITLRG